MPTPERRESQPRVSQEQLSAERANLMKRAGTFARRGDDRAIALPGEQRVSEATPVTVNILDREFLIGCTPE
jgi:hypothetical protein